MNAPFQPDPPEEPLRVEGAVQIVLADGISEKHALTLTFNRALVEREVEAYRKLPPTPTMLNDVRAYVERMLLAELVVRLFQFYVLGNIVLPDTPAAMDWLKSYLQGNGHGPMGQPLRWPSLCVSAVNLLTRWGFESSADGYVGRIKQDPDEPPVG